MEQTQPSAKRFRWKSDGRPLGFGASPEIDWIIIFSSTSILVVLVIILSAYMFIKINQGEIFAIEKPAEQGEQTLDISLLKETVSYYKNKAIKFERIKHAVKPAVDPSL